MLSVHGLSRHFGGVYALRDVNLDVGAGELRGIIGPNGAGKSTLFNVIGGHLPPDQGTITLRGQRIDRLTAHERARHGVAMVFQTARPFRGMTVLENVMVGAHCRTEHGFVDAMLRTVRHRREERQIRESARDALGRVGLDGLRDQPAESLPLGQQRSLQLARALAGAPEVLLLDEPASGLRGEERRDLAKLVGRLRTQGLTILLVEHDVALVTSLCERITVLDLGTVIAEGSPEEIRRHEAVVTAYLGASGSP